ncbi:GNAT family N-acetyltransferase [Paenibacillus sp. J5C_2022]|uniref:GNAT family N-acetyltransferase n=1 Tax=Paenibacillus sp. J5C2022 TaxID=2977129 RepID=UPI0021D00768|nr:GNAT family N-acetyltransferase [Paenibacillus sp. J5C2022]MCU6710669.1 GNAT family N-acetyltransferase [Paenibacillus sp. J5C2022]
MNAKFIEELSLNGWPSLSTVVYDGWLLRFSSGYTKRANSISPLYDSYLPLDEKIVECEQRYKVMKQPAIFKLTSFASPPRLDELLAGRGYKIVDRTSVQTRSLDEVKVPVITSVSLEKRASKQWLDTYSRLSGVTSRHRHTMEQMLGKIQGRTGYIMLYDDAREIVACGLGVVEREYIGLYDIVTASQHRNRGYGEQMILHLLHWGRDNSAKHSYLAVVADNRPAIRLYAKLGYKEEYTYWYRICAEDR